MIIFCAAENSFFADVIHKLKVALVDHDRYMYLLNGLKNTLTITVCAAILGITIGFIIAAVKVKRRTSIPGRAAVFLADLYLLIIRGTPVTVQLLITYYIIFASSSIDRMAVAILAFGINSGAYSAEIIRGGILAIDNGQTEAGRSLGFSSLATMRYIIMPQAIKNALPALCNEAISLLKETSVAGFIGVVDLTTAALYIKTATYDAFTPLLILAGVYLILVIGLTTAVRHLERRLRRGDSH